MGSEVQPEDPSQRSASKMNQRPARRGKLGSWRTFGVMFFAGVILLPFVTVPPATASTGVWAWGSDSSQQLGLASGPEQCWQAIPCSTKPALVEGLNAVESIAAGEEFSIALLENGTVKTWGSNISNQLGDGYSAKQQEESVTPALVSAITGAKAIAAGSNDAMALLENGTIKAWGENNAGELGNGKTLETTVPVAVKEISKATAVAMGEEDSLALLSNGHVMAWGSDETGQLGTGDTLQNRHVPKEVSGITTAAAIAAGAEFNLALLSSGTVKAWGNNNDGQLGDGTETGPNECKVSGYCAKTPVTVSGLSNVTAIAAGGGHGLALLSNGTVMGWGNNESGELGNHSTEESDVPVAVDDVKNAIAIAAGAESSVALLSNGELLTWGANGEGQLGTGATRGPEECEPAPPEPCSQIPIAIGTISGERQRIAAGGWHVLALGTFLP